MKTIHPLRNRFRSVIHPALPAAIALLMLGEVDAALVVDLVQSGNDVVATATGSADTRGVSISVATGFAAPQIWGTFDGFFRVGGLGGSNTYTFLASAGPGVWVNPSLPAAAATSSSSGSDTVGARASDNRIFLPAPYVSGTPINASSTWANTTVTDLGLTPGTYVWSWGSGENADSLTVNVVPEPSIELLSLLGLGAVWTLRRRR